MDQSISFQSMFGLNRLSAVEQIWVGVWRNTKELIQIYRENNFKCPFWKNFRKLNFIVACHEKFQFFGEDGSEFKGFWISTTELTTWVSIKSSDFTLKNVWCILCWKNKLSYFLNIACRKVSNAFLPCQFLRT